MLNKGSTTTNNKEEKKHDRNIWSYLDKMDIPEPRCFEPSAYNEYSEVFIDHVWSVPFDFSIVSCRRRRRRCCLARVFVAPGSISFPPHCQSLPPIKITFESIFIPNDHSSNFVKHFISFLATANEKKERSRSIRNRVQGKKLSIACAAHKLFGCLAAYSSLMGQTTIVYCLICFAAMRNGMFPRCILTALIHLSAIFSLLL